MPISVAIIEDDRGTRETLAQLVDKTPACRCVGAFATGEDAIAELPRMRAEVAVVDINLGAGMDGIKCVAQLKQKLPGLRVLMLTRHSDSEVIFNALRAGATGYVLKKMIAGELIPAIEQVHAGGAPMSMQVARQVVDYFHRIKQPASELEKLSKREAEVLALLAKGYLYKEIGDMLGITLDTVRVHAKHIYEKLQVHSRTEATVKFLGSS